MPGDDFPGVEVHHNAEIMPFSSRFDVSNVAGLYEIWGFLGKVLLQMISAVSVIGMSAGNRRFVGGHSGQL